VESGSLTVSACCHGTAVVGDGGGGVVCVDFTAINSHGAVIW
jgi:hypothetical protein